MSSGLELGEQGESIPHRASAPAASSGILVRQCGRLLPAVLLVLGIACCVPRAAQGQSLPTASRIGDLQVGGGFVLAHSGYNFTPIRLIGEAGYTTFDWRTYWGAEFDFHNSRSTTDSTVYERTYEIGPRIFFTRGRITPYAKIMYGRGVYNFHGGVANVAYNLYTYGGGADVRLTRWLNLRGDYELQNWMAFPLGTLHPSVVTIGLAYHFNSSSEPRFTR
jgi:hypothetical protein